MALEEVLDAELGRLGRLVVLAGLSRGGGGGPLPRSHGRWDSRLGFSDSWKGGMALEGTRSKLGTEIKKDDFPAQADARGFWGGLEVGE